MRALTFLLLLTIGLGADAGGIDSVRLRAESERSRVVFDLADAVTYRAFQMKNPNRVVIDIQNTAYPKNLSLPAPTDSSDAHLFNVLQRMRYAVRNEGDLRIVLDLNDGVDLQHTLLPPRQAYGHRLVIDLYRQHGSQTRMAAPIPKPSSKEHIITPATAIPKSNVMVENKELDSENDTAKTLVERSVPSSKILTGETPKLAVPAGSSDNGARALALLNGEKAIVDTDSSTTKEPKPSLQKISTQKKVSSSPEATTVNSKQVETPASQTTSKKPPRNVVIAIDAGHGGHDVGAIGPKGTYEKNIVLQISRELAATINKQQGMRAILTRSSDYYVGLRDRMQRARRQEADLFISIHADAFKDRRVSGSSVYVLSQHGASSEAARWLAENENAADLVGGVSLGDKDDVVKSVLLDLSQTASIDASIDAADTVLAALKKIGKVHKPAVQHAGFMVLKSPDIPSLLVETAFISNPKEEAKLRSKRYQRKLARALTDGVMRYFNENPLPDTRFAENYRRRHKVNSGDTLSEIAERYAVSMESIKLANEMSRDRVRTGEILTIP